jgi:hypothetical protein
VHAAKEVGAEFRLSVIRYQSRGERWQRTASGPEGPTPRREVRTSNKYLALCVFWAILGERLHFGIRESDFEEGKSNQAPNPSEVEAVVRR